jgi:hypothetical protein
MIVSLLNIMLAPRDGRTLSASSIEQEELGVVIGWRRARKVCVKAL